VKVLTTTHRTLPFERGVTLSEDDMIRQHVIMELMSNFKMDIKRFNEDYDVDFNTYFKEDLPDLQPFIEEGLVVMDKNHIVCSETASKNARKISSTMQRQAMNVLSAGCVFLSVPFTMSMLMR
jgi:coproporphyrinogen III oxidase-like Fe-S oxidoreductase